MIICIYDTETTGKLDFKSPPDAPHQPYLVQLAYALFDTEDWKVIRAWCSVIEIPKDVIIPDEVIKLHGINTLCCYNYGASVNKAILGLAVSLDLACHAYAYNADFDIAIITGACKRNNVNIPQQLIRTFDVMKPLTDIIRLPGLYGKYKWPKLSEAFEYFYPDQSMGDAHNALGDVYSTAKVLKAFSQMPDAPENFRF